MFDKQPFCGGARKASLSRTAVIRSAKMLRDERMAGLVTLLRSIQYLGQGPFRADFTSVANIAGASLEVRKCRAKALGQEIVLVFPLRKAVQFFEGPGRSVDPSARRHEV